MNLGLGTLPLDSKIVLNAVYELLCWVPQNCMCDLLLNNFHNFQNSINNIFSNVTFYCSAWKNLLFNQRQQPVVTHSCNRKLENRVIQYLFNITKRPQDGHFMDLGNATC